MEELHDLDEVAYVRFASVYRSFQDVDAFREEIERMRHRRTAKRPKVSSRCGPARTTERRSDLDRSPLFDERMMQRALELAALGRYTTHPNPRVGCVIAQGERIVGEGWHRKSGEPHAEPLALQAAGDAARGATVYVTLEPHSIMAAHRHVPRR